MIERMPDLLERFSRTGAFFSSLFKNMFFWGGLGLLLVIMFAVYLIVDQVMMPSYTRQGTSVVVPNVLNQPFEQARSELEGRELDVEMIVQRYNANFPRDVVTDQNPPPNARVKPGRDVYLTVNSGDLQRVSVPELEGLSLREAINRLRARGLEVSETIPDSMPAPNVNTVTRQQPSAGDSLDEGSSVKLWYSTGLGAEYVSIPEVTGITVAEAEQQLLDARLRYVVIGAEEADDVSEHIVMRQSREPGTRVREGFEIRLYLDEEAPAPPDGEGEL